MGKAFLQSASRLSELKRVVAGSTIDGDQKETVTAFLANPFGDYAASGGEIVGILKEMKDEMDRDLGGIIGQEEQAQKNYDGLVATKNAEIAAATEGIEKKSVRSGELAVEITEDKNSLANTQDKM